MSTRHIAATVALAVVSVLGITGCKGDSDNGPPTAEAVTVDNTWRKGCRDLHKMPDGRPHTDYWVCQKDATGSIILSWVIVYADVDRKQAAMARVDPSYAERFFIDQGDTWVKLKNTELTD